MRAMSFVAGLGGGNGSGAILIPAPGSFAPPQSASPGGEHTEKRGATMTSVKDVAARAGVSVGTVSNVLNRPAKVAPSTVSRVHAAIEELGFVRNGAAHQLRAGSSRSVGLVVLDAGNPFFADVARGAEQRAAAAGLNVLTGNSDDDPAREEAYLDLFDEHRVRGILITPAGDVLSRLAALRDRGIPSVLVDRTAEGHDLPSVSVDDVAGGDQAASHLIEGGRRRLMFVGGTAGIRQVADRLAGAGQAVARHPHVSLEVMRTSGMTVHDGIEAGTAIGARAPGDRPDGIFAVNDLVALGVMQALIVNHGVRIPSDVALIGYDDIDFASSSIVALSSIRQPAREIGFRAMDLLLGGGGGGGASGGGGGSAGGSVVFQPELVTRESTAPRRSR